MPTILNKHLRSHYEVLESLEAGIRLTGAEVKSIKRGSMHLKGSYVRVEENELWLEKAHIAAYQAANQPGYDPERPRKLLVHKSELDRLRGKMDTAGLTIVPEKVYTSRGLVKVQIALARGLKKHDKRAKIKERDIKRDLQRKMREQ